MDMGGMTNKSNLEILDILPSLIKKINNPSQYMFYGCRKFNPI